MPKSLFFLMITLLVIALIVPSYLLVNPISRTTTEYQTVTRTQTKTVLIPTTSTAIYQSSTATQTVLIPTTFTKSYTVTQAEATYLNFVFAANQSLCPNQSVNLIVVAPFSLSSIVGSISSNFANANCISIEDAFQSNASAVLLCVIYEVCDIGITSNYSNYLQLVQLAKQKQPTETPIAFQIGNVSSGPLFWMVSSFTDEYITNFVQFANNSVLSSDGN